MSFKWSIAFEDWDITRRTTEDVTKPQGERNEETRERHGAAEEHSQRRTPKIAGLCNFAYYALLLDKVGGQGACKFIN
eukprot:3376545-Amphidinium_carterae.1